VTAPHCHNPSFWISVRFFEMLFSRIDFAADLQASHEKKHRHQSVADPEVQIALKSQGAEFETDGNTPQSRIKPLFMEN